MFFFQDDFGILLQLKTLSFFQYLITPWSAYFLPIFRLISYIEFTLFRMNFLPYVVVTLILHVLNVFLIGHLTFRLTTSNYLKFASMAFFAIQVSYTEPLLWFTVQTLPLSVFCIGLAFDQWLSFLETNKKEHFFLNCIFCLLAGFSFGIGVSVSLIFLFSLIFFWHSVKKSQRQVVLYTLITLAVATFFIGPLMTNGKIGRFTPIISNIFHDFILFGLFVISGVSRGVVGRFFLPGFEPRHFEVFKTIVSFTPFLIICFQVVMVYFSKRSRLIKKRIGLLMLFIVYPYIWAGFLRYQHGLKQALAERYAYPSVFFFVIFLMMILYVLYKKKIVKHVKIVTLGIVCLQFFQFIHFIHRSIRFEIPPLQAKEYLSEVSYIAKKAGIILNLPLPSYIHQEYSLVDLKPLIDSDSTVFVDVSKKFCHPLVKKSLHVERIANFYLRQMRDERVKQSIDKHVFEDCLGDRIY